MASIVGKRGVSRPTTTWWSRPGCRASRGSCPAVPGQCGRGDRQAVRDPGRTTGTQSAQAVRGLGGGVVDAGPARRGWDRRRGGAPLRQRGRDAGHLSGVGVREPGGGPVLQAGLRRLVETTAGGRWVKLDRAAVRRAGPSHPRTGGDPNGAGSPASGILMVKYCPGSGFGSASSATAATGRADGSATARRPPCASASLQCRADAWNYTRSRA